MISFEKCVADRSNSVFSKFFTLADRSAMHFQKFSGLADHSDSMFSKLLAVLSAAART